MRLRSSWMTQALLLGTCLLAIPLGARADRVEFKDGTQLEGIILKVEKGQVTMSVGQNQRQFSILDVTRMDFDTPHVPPGVSQHSLEHFAASTESQEVDQHIQDVDKAATDLRQSLDQIEKQWSGRKNLAGGEAASWDATKDQFSRALSRYQELLGDLYAHVLSRVDQYTGLTKEADGVRVGVQGAFRASPLVSKDQEEAPLKKFVPNPWYDTIFYEGYNLGYTEGYYGARPREFVAPQ
jgi:uncharacterized protein YukE